MRPLDPDFSLTTASTASFGLDNPTFGLNDPISASTASFGLNDPIPASIGLSDPISASMASVKGLVHQDLLTKLSYVKQTRPSRSFNKIILS